MIVFICMCLVTFWLLYHGLNSIWKPRNFPPGPWGLPFVGSFYHISGDYSRNAKTLVQKYGNIIGLKLKGVNVVCINGYDLFKQVMTDNPKCFSDRACQLPQTIIRGEKHEGIVTTPYGPQLLAHRKLFYSVLRNMGLNHYSFEKIIIEELPYLIEELKACVSDGKSTINPCAVFDYAALNVLAYFTFGNRYSYKDEKFKFLLGKNLKCFEMMSKINTPSFLFVSYIPFLYKIWLPHNARVIKEGCRDIAEFVESEVTYHKASLDPKNPRDFIDHYLIEVTSNHSHLFTDSFLKMTIMDFFQAGTETTSTTLKWAVLYMVNNPEVQEKVQNEIDRELAFHGMPKYEDRLKMPYTEATVLEIQRKANIAPIGLVHVANKDTKLGKYDIPKSTYILPIYESIHHSHKYWKNPSQFDPENFLDQDGKVGTRSTFMPFGGGLRVCLGMNIAKQELFLFFVTMLQHFKLQLPPGVSKLDEEYVPGFTLQPKPYEIVMSSRF
uniref:Cytochrome P450 2C42-like n=1 Tax=Phallusia mammillata TaxID=59560 RepID=A0A6F9DB67_9ASCI|nr:cytochrome P450 2C42-like [Phallusia mammillata]